MHFPRLSACVALLLASGAHSAFAAAEPAAAASAEAQLREALRTVTLQLRTAQGDLAAAKAEKDQLAVDKDALAKRLEALDRQAAADRTAAKTNLANLNSQLAAKDAEAARLADNLKRTLDARDASSRLADDREQARATLAQELVERERVIAELRRQNRDLFATGNEILDRYEAFGLGRAITAREPFTKLTRVKLQNLVQDYQDSLEAGRAKLPAGPAPVAAN